MKLRYTRTALRQIDAALSYTAARSPQGASGLIRRVTSAISFLQNHPHAAQATSRPNTRRFALTPYPYVLFYRVAPDEIVITRLRHTSRKPLSGDRPT